MASSHKHLWSLSDVRMYCLKKDPSKLSLRIWCIWISPASRKGKTAGCYEIHKLPTRILEGTIKDLSEKYTKGPYIAIDKQWYANCEQALDYLFAELGRRAARKVIS